MELGSEYQVVDKNQFKHIDLKIFVLPGKTTFVFVSNIKKLKSLLTFNFSLITSIEKKW